MGVEKQEQNVWWPENLQPFAFYFATFTDPLDQERAHKRVQHIITDHKKDIGSAVQFLAQDILIGRRWDRKYSSSYSDGKTYFDPVSRTWKPSSSQPTQLEQTPKPAQQERSYRIEPTIY